MATDSTAPKPSRLLSLLKWPAILVIAAFVVSEFATDSVVALQWVWFVPRPLLAGAALLWALIALAAVRGLGRDRPEARGLVAVGVLSAACVGVGLLEMWGLPKARPTDALRIVHWNASYPLEENMNALVLDELIDLGGDIVVLTDAGQLATGERALRCLAAGYEIHRPGRFTLLSRLPVIEATPIAAAKRGSASRIVVSTKWGPISIRAIDLPSDPRLPREQTAGELAALVAGADPTSPDLLIGDFNTPGGSNSLRAFGTGYVDAFAHAGAGWGGTYPAKYPFWRIDLALVRSPWKALRAEAVDLDGRRHRAQAIDLRRDEVER
ncbi:MAG: hypothetical protein RLY21_2704 [Planctomycetota bacterium]|jgi:endonuclease/exonuclease/phosphatase (EEP) superfamily protein YafD